jgi:hypothetical protein
MSIVDDLRRHDQINQGRGIARIERIPRTAFTFSEQAFTVETALRTD